MILLIAEGIIQLAQIFNKDIRRQRFVEFINGRRSISVEICGASAATDSMTRVILHMTKQDQEFP